MSNDTSPAGDTESAGTRDASPSASTLIGNYRLLRKLGVGGMGEVWEAEQQQPVRRRVAFKLIKWGMDTRAVVARFEAERQALALMNHRNVAKIFDAGATEQGRPYFVMELVHGEPITKHCDRERLTTAERLELFLHVCDGVQHAHLKGIIHRDIKPSNILVQIDGDERTPKIIDFGVAKATHQRLTERTLSTELGQPVGTPEYMSPEQAEMTVEDIDTRTDVYSLGVVLYELLAGALPFDLKSIRQEAFDEIRRQIRQVEPSRPSARLSTLDGEALAHCVHGRRADLRGLRRELSGDLDWITMKSLEKSRTRRYSSPAELAADILRHLKHEPVLAGPPSRLYRLGKFCRRHRVALLNLALVLVVTSLAGIAGLSTRWYSPEEVAGRRFFLMVRDRPAQVPRLLRSQGHDLDTPLRSILESLGTYAASAEAPKVEAVWIHYTLRETYWEFGEWPAAIREQQHYLQYAQSTWGEDSAQAKAEWLRLARFQCDCGDDDAAEQTLLDMRRLFDQDFPWFALYARIHAERGEAEAAQPMLASARGLASGTEASERSDFVMALQSLELYEEAETMIGPAIADEPDNSFWHERQGWGLQKLGRFADAALAYERAIALAPAGRGAENPLFAYNSLGIAYEALDRPEDAVRIYERALEIDPDHAWTQKSLGAVQRRQGHFGAAEQVHELAKRGEIGALESLIANDPGLVHLKVGGGETALHAAAAHDRADAVSLLIASGAVVDARDGGGETPLRDAAREGHTGVMTVLLAKGADVNATDDDGDTSLHKAAQYGHTAAAGLLITKGANTALTNRAGETPLAAATRAGSTEIVALLKAQAEKQAPPAAQPGAAK